MDRRRAGALLALAACIACSAAAPTASNLTALDIFDDKPVGCYYNFQHYGEGDRIMTNEPCLNCTCHNRMLMCYLRVCPFTKPIGQDCTIEKRADQCCPIVTCPDVPVDLLTSTSTTSPAEYGATGLGKLDKYGCSINDKYFPEGSKVPPTPNKPCEHCYCIRNMTTCVMQECTLHVDGCTPIYHKDVCCPVRYSCDHSEDEMLLLDDMSTTVRPTPGFLLTTTTISPVTQMTQDCVHDDQIFADGALIKTEKACEHCYCMKGDIVCVVQECGTPMENEGKNCTSLPPREGQCCPDTYICEGDDLTTDLSTDLTTESMLDISTTISPPRRSSVEGSGYRNEPDEVLGTEIPSVQLEHEGSGDGQTMVPLDTTEKLASKIPVDSLNTLQTTIRPSFGEPEYSTQDEYSSEVTESRDYATTTSSIPVERGDEEIDIKKDLTTKSSLESDELVTTTLDAKNYDSITKQPEDFNTVPDHSYGEEGYTPHKHIPSKPHDSTEETDITTPLVIEKEVTGIISEEEADKKVDTLPSSTEKADESTQSTKEYDTASVESVTEKESYEYDQFIPSTTSTSVFSDVEKTSPEIHDDETYPNIKDKGDAESEAQVSSTVKIPTPKEEEEKATTELDHDQNTIAVADDDIIHPNIYSTTVKTSRTEAEVTTLLSLELGSGAEEVTEENVFDSHEYVATLSPVDKESTEGGVVVQEKELTTISTDKMSESSSEASKIEGTTISEKIEVSESEETRRSDSKSTIPSESSIPTSESTVTRGDHFTITTEPSFRKEDEITISTEKPKDLETTTLKNDFTDEGFIPTSIQDEKLSSGPSVPSIEQEFTTSLPDNISESKESTTESVFESSISSETIPEKLPKLPSEEGNESLFGAPSTEKILEITTINAEYDTEHHAESARIPGEGDCLLNGVTYKNNSAVPSTNNCHSECKCASSIIKCDPIICSPPPDYMDNCQSIYDSLDACCPTYVCDHPRETVPPQSDNQMFGTETPLPSPAIECRGDQCEIDVDTKQPVVSSDKFDTDKCGPEGCKDVVQKPDDSKYSDEHPEKCKDGKCETPTKDCTSGKCEELPIKDLICDSEHGCQAGPVTPCEGEHCKTISIEVATQTPPQACENEEDCKNLQVIPCDGDSCKFEVPSPGEIHHEPCKEVNGCKPTHDTEQKCEDDACKKTEIPSVEHKLTSECEDSECVAQTEKMPVDVIFNLSTESSTQEQTSEINTEEPKLITKIPEATELQKETTTPVTQQQTNIADEHKDSSTTLPETLYTMSNEFVTESESTKESNELYESSPEGKRTTISESFAVDSEKSPTVSTATESNIVDISRTQQPDAQTPVYEKYTTQVIDQDKLLDIHTTESHYLATDTSDDEIKDSSVDSTEPTLQSVVEDGDLTSSEPKITIPDIVAHDQTTEVYSSEPTTAKKLQDTPMTLPESQEIETLTTQSSAENELNTDGLPSSVTLHPKEEINTPSTETENEITTQKAVQDVTIAGIGITANDIDINELTTVKIDTEGSKISSIETISKSTEATTEEQYGYTDSSEYESLGTKPKETGPVIIEPQEGLTTEIQKPYLNEDTTVKISDNSEYVTEKDEIETELPVKVSYVPELFTTTPSATYSEHYVTEELHITEENETKSPVEYSEPPEQFTTGTPVRVIEEETDTEINPIIKEHETKIPVSFTSAPVKDLTEVEKTLSTGQELTTTEKSLPSASEATISIEQTDKSIGHYGPFTTEGINEILEMTLPNSEKPLYPDSLSIGVTKPQDIDKKATGKDTTEKQEEFTTIVSVEDTSSVSVKEEMGTEVPLTESGLILTEKSTQSEKSEEEMYLVTSELPEFGTKAPIPEINETTDTEKLPAFHETVMDLSTESPEPVKHVTDHDENRTEYLDTQGIQEQSIGTESPQKEPSKAPNFYGTEDYKTETQSTTTKTTEPQETGSSRTTTEVSLIPEIVKEYTEGSIETHESSTEEQTVPDTQKESTESYIDTELIVTKSPVSQDTTNIPEAYITEQDNTVDKSSTVPIESGFTQIVHTTESQDIGTNVPDTYGSEDEKTESPIQQLTDSVEKITGDALETDVTESGEAVTKYPEDIKQSETEPSKQEEYATKNPELEISVIPESTQEPSLTIDEQDKKTTKTPEVIGISELDVSRRAEEVTKAPEQENKATETTKESITEIITQKTDITEAPEVTKESELSVTTNEESTKTPTYIQESEGEVTTLEEITTEGPQFISEDDKVTIDLEKDATKRPMESSSEYTKQEEVVTGVPEVTIEPLSESTVLEGEVTKSPEVVTELQPEGIKQEDDIVATTEYTKVSLPEISKQEKEVTKAPEENKESLLDVTEQEDKFTKVPEKTESSPEYIGQEEQEVTRSPEATTELLLEFTEKDKVTNAPEDKKESLPAFTVNEEDITKSPEENKESPEDKDEHVTKAPEVTKDFLSENTSPDEKVTLTPGDKIESLPEVTEKEKVWTIAPEDTKVSVPDITTQVETFTKVPEETNEVLSDVTEQGMDVTKIPENKQELLPEITEEEGEETTKSPVDLEQIQPEVTGYGEGITKSPEHKKETLPTVTEQEQQMTQSPEDKTVSPVDMPDENTKISLPEITESKYDVTKSPEESNELLPEVTEQGIGVTKTPEDRRETLPEVTEKEADITKSPEEKEPLFEISSTPNPEVITEDTLPQITEQEEKITKSPEDIKESVPDITQPTDEVTKAPEVTAESLPKDTKQEEAVTKAPENTISSLPVTTEFEKEVTKTPDDIKEPLLEDTRPEEEVTKTPDDVKISLPEITQQIEEEATKYPDDMNLSLSEITRQDEEVTRAPDDVKEPDSEVTREEEEITKAPQDTAEKETRPEVTSEDKTITKTPETEQETTDEAVTEQQDITLTTHGDHIATENIIPVYSESDNELLEHTTPKQVEYTATELSQDKFSETTPDVIILEEHTHKFIEATPTAGPQHEHRTTLAYDTEEPEEVSEVSSTKPTGEYLETVTIQAEIPTSSGVSQTALHTFDQVTEKDLELTVSTEEILSVHKHDEDTKDKEPTIAPTLGETTTTAYVEKTTVFDSGLPTKTEKVPSISDQSVYAEITPETTVVVDELLTATTKATTIKEEELVTPTNPPKHETTVISEELVTTTSKATTAKQDEELITKPTTSEEQPIKSSEVTPSTTVQESPKPIAGETHPTEELPIPEDDSNFPPSGMSGYGEPDYVEEDQAFGPGTCRYGGKVYVSAQQIPRDDPCDFCFCFRSDIICLQQSCPPPIHGCHEEPIQGFCCPRYECPVSMATTINVTTTTTTTTTTLPPHFPTHSYKGAAQRRGCQIKGHTYKVGEVVRSSSGPCLHCTCGGDGQMKCDPKACTPEPMLRQMIAAAVSAKRRR